MIKNHHILNPERIRADFILLKAGSDCN